MTCSVEEFQNVVKFIIENAEKIAVQGVSQEKIKEVQQFYEKQLDSERKNHVLENQRRQKDIVTLEEKIAEINSDKDEIQETLTEEMNKNAQQAETID